MKLFSLFLLAASLAAPIYAHDDPATHADHERVLTEVVPIANATHVARASGNWSSSYTWWGGVPIAGARVHIPAGLSVTFNTTTPHLHWLRVDGQLTFARNRNTSLCVETMVVGDSGGLEVGTKLNPLMTQATITIKRGSPKLHWTQIDCGLLVFGNLSIWGANVTSWDRVMQNPLAGDSTITMVGAPAGWQPGGLIIVPGVFPHGSSTLAKFWALAEPDPRFRLQHELMTIQSVVGNVVTLTSPLLEDTHHQLAESREISVGYLTRNIAIQSGGSDLASRGHIMLMPGAHANRRYDIGYCSLINLGRTHADNHVTDPYLDAVGGVVVGSDENPRGRYALHFHKMGPDNYASVQGVAVVGALKWGIVNHGSVVDVEDCVSWDCDGAHYATESGQERGSFLRNMGVRSQGFGKSNNRGYSQRFLGGGGQDKLYTDRWVNVQERMRIAPVGDDFGFAGYGIWLQGPLMRVDDNELYGALQSGITVKTTPVGTDHQGEPIVIARDMLPDDLDAALPGSFQQKAPAGFAPIDAIPYEIGANRVYGSWEALVGMDNGPPLSHRSRFQSGSNYNCTVGTRNWESNGQIIDNVEFLNHEMSPGKAVNSFYDGTSNMLFTDVKALNFNVGIGVPQTGTNVIEGADTFLLCQTNIHFQAETNASNRTFIRLASTNLGVPTANFDPAKQMNIVMDVHPLTSTLPQRNVEWHRPDMPAIRLWSNPALAPPDAFSIPKFNGVVTPL